MARTYKTLTEQVQAMRRHWPEFEAARALGGGTAWFGPLVGLGRTYRVMIEYGPVPPPPEAPFLAQIPLVRVLNPRLEPRWDAQDEVPLPHVFFEKEDITLSPLCLFDPDNGQWSPADLIAEKIVPWAVDWLVCYEGWLATGRWHGGGRHAAERKCAA
jgi:hypothetical protein